MLEHPASARPNEVQAVERQKSEVGLDTSHPVVNGLLLPPSNIALELLHLGAWQTVDGLLDKHLCLDRAELATHRRSDRSARHVPCKDCSRRERRP